MLGYRQITLILGGSGSGKSAYAETVAGRLQAAGLPRSPEASSHDGQPDADRPLIYVATMAADQQPETLRRIERHRAQRARWPFQTLEVPRFAPLPQPILPAFLRGGVVLLDCLGNLLANMLFAPPAADPGAASLPEANCSASCTDDIDRAAQRVVDTIEQGLFALAQDSAHLVVVSNDIFEDAAPQTRETRAYIRALGALHARLAAAGAHVFSVHMGGVVPVSPR